MGFKTHGMDDVFENMSKFERRVYVAQDAAGAATAVTVGSEAKQNRPWNDQTNLARLGLTGSSETKGRVTTVALAHTVYYGIFLELANAGRFGIIQRTIDSNRSLLQNNFKKLLGL